MAGELEATEAVSAERLAPVKVDRKVGRVAARVAGASNPREAPVGGVAELLEAAQEKVLAVVQLAEGSVVETEVEGRVPKPDKLP